MRSRSFRFVVIDEAFGRGSDESAQYGLKLFRQLNLQLLIVTLCRRFILLSPLSRVWVLFTTRVDGHPNFATCQSKSTGNKTIG